MEFQIGDKAVYPAHGVGEIIAIESKEIAGTPISFYIMRILDSDMTIMIPMTNVESVGLREVISKSKITSVYKVLRQRDITIDLQTWNRRYREYMKKIRTGSVYEIAEVLRDLVLLKDTKSLSFGEKKMLETAKNLLIKEFSISKTVDEAKIEKEMEKIFDNKLNT